MTKFIKHIFCCLFVLMLSWSVKGQLSGVYTVPGNYPTLAAAISALNSQGVSGPVFIDIQAGHLENAPAGGYSLTATGTLANPVTFRKSGVGANPLISSGTGGTGTPGSGTQDGIWRFIGCDYITIDGIDLVDVNLTNPSTMEYGFGFFKASVANGCQNNTIQNCTISLKIVNNATGSGPAADGSRGINMVNSLATSQTSALTPTSAAGANSNNRFYGNTIKNCNVGISIIGYVAPSPFTLADTGNDIGGPLSANGNTIVNFGGAASAANAAAGIRTLAQYNLNVSNNTINNNDGSGVNHVAALRGIYINTAVSANVTVLNNTLTINSAGSTAAVAVIENVSGATAANNTVNISNNLISNCSNAANTTGAFFGIYNNGASAAYLNVTNNSFSNVSTKATTGTGYLIYNTGAVQNAITINNNLVSGCTNSASTSGAYYNIFNNIASPAALNISSNTFSNNTSFAATGATHLIYNASATSNTITLTNNLVTGCANSISSTGAFYGIFNNGASTANLSISSNTFTNHILKAFSGASHLIYNTGTISGSVDLSNNIVSGSTNSITSTGSYYAIYNNAASTTTLNISNNTFSGNTSVVTSGSVHLVFNRGTATTTFVSLSLADNFISGCTYSASSNGPFLGIYNSGVRADNLNMSGNTISDNSWLTTSSVKFLVYNTGSVTGTLDLNNNLVANCTATNNTSGTFNGIYNTGACTVAVNMCNNTFTNVSNNGTSGGSYYMYNSGAVAGGVISMTNNLVAGCTNSITGTGDFYGMHNLGTSYSSLNAASNTFSSNIFVSSGGATNLIYNTGAVSSAVNDINLSNNLISNCTNSVSGGGSFYGIYNNAASCVNLSITANVFINNSSYAVSGSNYMIYNRGALTNTFASISLDKNLISNCTNSTSANAPFYTIWNNGITSTVTSISNNSVTNVSWASSTSARYLISNWSVAKDLTSINNNLISGCTASLNTTGFFYGIYNNNNTSASSASLSINNNTLTNNFTSAAGGETHLINNSGAVSNTFTAVDILNNMISGNTSSVTSTGAYYGIYNNSASATTLNISANTFTDHVLITNTGASHLVYNRGIAGNVFDAVNLNANRMGNITHSVSSNGAFYAIYNNGAATTTMNLLSVMNNTLLNSVSTGTSNSINLIHTTCPVTNSISLENNLISDWTNSLTTTGNFVGLNNGGNSQGSLTIRNNTFTTLQSAATTGNRTLINNSGAITNSISISNNLVANCSHTASSSGTFNGINNTGSGSCLSLSIRNNVFNNNYSSSSTNGNTNLMINTGAVSATVTTVEMENNAINNYTVVGTNGTFSGIINSGVTSQSVSLVTNTLTNILVMSPARTQQLVGNSGKVTDAVTIADNLISDYTSLLNTTGALNVILCNGNYAGGNFPSALGITNNRFLNSAVTSSNATVFFINNSGAATNTISSCVINNNLLSNLNASVTGGGALYGIFSSAFTTGSLSVNNNTFTGVSATSTTSARYMIFTGGTVTAAAEVSDNLLSNITSSANTTGSYYGINTTALTQGNLSIRNNVLSDHTLSATTGSVFAFYNTGVVSNSISIRNNLVSGLSHTATSSGGFLGIYNNAGSSSNLDISANTFTTTSLISGAGTNYFIFNRGATTSSIGVITITNNILGASSYSANAGAFAGIVNNGTAFGNLSVESNTIANTAITSLTSVRYSIYNTGVGSGSMAINNNRISDLTSLGNTTGSYFGINNGGNQTGDLTITNNAFVNHSLSASSGSALVIYNSGAVNNLLTITNNSVSVLTQTATSSGGLIGIYNGPAVATASCISLNISSNTFSTISLSTLTGALGYIYNRGAATNSIQTTVIGDNLVSGSTYTATSGPFYGVLNNVISTGSLSVKSNSFVTISSAATTGARYFIYNTGTVSLGASIINNRVSNYNAPLNTTGAFYNVFNSGASAGDLTISGNTFSAQLLPSTTGVCYLINNTGAVANTASINNNLFSGITQSCTTAAAYVISNTGQVSGSSYLDNNSIANSTYSSNSTGVFYGINSLTSATLSTLSMSGNTFSNTSVKNTGASIYMVYNSGAGSVSNSLNMDNNQIHTFTNTSPSGVFYGLHNSAVSSGDLSFSNNTFTNCVSASNTGARYLIYNTGPVISTASYTNNLIAGYTSSLNTTAGFYGILHTAASGSLSISYNTFSNVVLRSTTGSNYILQNSGTAAVIFMNNNAISNITHSTTASGSFFGLFNTSNASSGLAMNSNSFTTVNAGPATGAMYMIQNVALVSNSVSMNDNVISGVSNSSANSGDFIGIFNASSGSGDLSMNNNTLANNNTAASMANTNLIYNSGSFNAAANISNNNLGFAFTNSSGYFGTLNNIINTGGVSTTSLSINSNSFGAYPITNVNSSGNIYFIQNGGTNNRCELMNNGWSNISLNHTGNEYLMYNTAPSLSELNVINNAVSGYTRTGNTAPLYMYYSNGNSPGTCTQIFSGNTFSNISSGNLGPGSFYGFFNMDGGASPYPKKLIFNNSITNVNFNGLGFLYGFYQDFMGDGTSGAGSAVYNNTLSSISCAGPVYGLQVAGNISPNFAVSIYSNTIQNITSSGTTADVYGAYLAGSGLGQNYYKNKVSDLTANGVQGRVCGVGISGSGFTTLSNNLIGGVYTPSSSASDPLNGISVDGNGRTNLFYNTVHLDAVSTGANFSSNALYALSSVTLHLRNNILINNSTPNGNGIVTAYRRSSAGFSSYLLASNNNNFYAGIPSANHVVFSDGTTSYGAISAYQAIVTPRDNASVSENTPFLSTAGTNSNFLHVDVTIPSLTESGGVSIPGITDDFDNDIRQGNPGYSGTGTAPDIGADEYDQSLTPCTAAHAGIVTVLNPTVICAGKTAYMFSTGYTAAGDIVHQWKVSTTQGGPYVNVSGGTGANLVNYTTGTLTPGSYYYVMVTSCTLGTLSHTSNEVMVTVDPVPVASASVANQVICSGQSLNFTGTSTSGLSYAWTGPNNFTSTAQSPLIPGAVTNASGNYTFIATDANCSSMPAVVSVTVNPNPPTFSLGPQSASMCIGNSQTLTASIPITSPTLSFGGQTNQNAISGYPAPYSVYYGGQKMQMLILAGEMAAAGFTTGSPIVSVQFPVASLGANWNNTLFNCQNFMVGIKATTSSVLNTFETGVSNVLGPINFVPAIGYNNIHNFSSPFIWDGSSNVVIETVFSNAIAGTGGNTVIQYNSPTGFQSTLVYRADNQNVSTIAAATTSNVNVGFVRPDFKLNGIQVGTYSWTPSNGLSSTIGHSVIANPTVTTVYSVQLSDGQCASTASVQLNVILVPTISIAATSNSVCSGNNATLTANGASTYTWNSGSTQTSIVVAPFGTSTYTVTGSNPSCPVATATVSLSSLPALVVSTAASPSVLCEGETSTLTVTGANTYTWMGTTAASSMIVTPSVTTSYSVFAENGPGCWTNKTVLVKVNPLPVITISPPSATLCLGESILFEASGVLSFTWMPGNSNSPIFAVSPVASTTYSVTGKDLNGCYNSTSVSITVDPCTGINNTATVANQLLVLPNPSSGVFTVRFNLEGKKDIRVENSLGALIYAAQTSEFTESIDLTGMAKGVYFLRIKCGEISTVSKLIID